MTSRRYLESNAGLIVASVVSVFFVLNISGFCYTHLRYLRDDEIVKEVVDSEFSRDRQGKLDDYRDGADFLERNEGCCQVSSASQDSNFLFRLLGGGRWDVYIIYKIQGKQKAENAIVVYTIDCCGGIWGRRADD